MLSRMFTLIFALAVIGSTVWYANMVKSRGGRY